MRVAPTKFERLMIELVVYDVHDVACVLQHGQHEPPAGRFLSFTAQTRFFPRKKSRRACEICTNFINTQHRFCLNTKQLESPLSGNSTNISF